MPIIPAPTNIQIDCILPARKKAITIPGSTECEMASPTIDIFLNTRKEPKMAQLTATNDPVNMIQNASMINW